MTIMVKNTLIRKIKYKKTQQFYIWEIILIFTYGKFSLEFIEFLRSISLNCLKNKIAPRGAVLKLTVITPAALCVNQIRPSPHYCRVYVRTTEGSIKTMEIIAQQPKTTIKTIDSATVTRWIHYSQWGPSGAVGVRHLVSDFLFLEWKTKNRDCRL